MNVQELQVLLTVQSQGYKDALQLFVARFDEQFDKLLKRIGDLEKSNEQKDRLNNDLLNHIVKVEQELESVKHSNVLLKKDISEIKEKSTNLEERCNDLEDRSRRYNLRITGLTEEPNETWDKTRGKVTELCTRRLGLPEVRLEVAHRTGPRRHDRPRTIVARFQRFDDREAVMRNAKKLKSSGIRIHEDLCAASVKKRNDQWPELVQHRNEGRFAKFVHTRLYVRAAGTDTSRGPRDFPPPSSASSSQSSTPTSASTPSAPLGSAEAVSSPPGAAEPAEDVVTTEQAATRATRATTAAASSGDTAKHDKDAAPKNKGKR